MAKTGKDFLDFLNNRIKEYDKTINEIKFNNGVDSPTLQGVKKELEYIEKTARLIYWMEKKA